MASRLHMAWQSLQDMQSGCIFSIMYAFLYLPTPAT